MSQEAAAQPDEKTMRLRYAGACRECGQALPAGTFAVYERARKTVRCVTCPPDPDRLSGGLSDPGPDAASVPSELAAADALAPVDLDPGRAGGFRAA